MTLSLKMLESKIEAKVVKHCQALGMYVRKLGSGSARGYNGLPDRMICFRGKVLFLELKGPGKNPTPLQAREIKLLQEQGMRATWADSYESAVELIDDYFAEEIEESNVL